MSIATPVKRHGGKGMIAKWIVSHFPPVGSYIHYCEPYAGGLSVMLAAPHERINEDDETVSNVGETVNDLDESVSNFWRIMADPDDFQEFARRVQATPVSESAFRSAHALLESSEGSPVDRAAAFFVLARQSMGGRCTNFAPLVKSRLRRGMCEAASSWLSAVDGLAAVHGRLSRVVVLCRPALDVIQELDSPQTFHYLDPPYCPDTRAAKNAYAQEMTLDDHRELLATILDCRGKVLISGYDTPLYGLNLVRRRGWRRFTRQVANHAAGNGGGKAKRRMVECLWRNY